MSCFMGRAVFDLVMLITLGSCSNRFSIGGINVMKVFFFAAGAIFGDVGG